ncbi:Uncharacterised protein r2_g3272 [Pycnogonum litorale]
MSISEPSVNVSGSPSFVKNSTTAHFLLHTHGYATPFLSTLQKNFNLCLAGVVLLTFPSAIANFIVVTIGRSRICLAHRNLLENTNLPSFLPNLLNWSHISSLELPKLNRHILGHSNEILLGENNLKIRFHQQFQ